MKWWKRLAIVFALLVAAGALASRPAPGAVAQPSEEDDLAATVEALQTRVAELEERVAALEGDASGEDDVPDSDGATSTAEAVETPAADERGGETAGTRDDPLPFGAAGPVGDYSVTVIEVVPNATDLVLAENQFNEPPAAGAQFYLVTVEVTYVGRDTGNPAFDLNFQAVGAASVAYSTYDNSCDVIPNDQFMANELFSGGTIRFNVCWEVPSADADSLVMFVEPSFSFDAEPVFFALQDE